MRSALRIPFAEFVAENFRSVADLTWDLKDGRVLAHFNVDQARVAVQFDGRAPGEWTVSFETLNTSGQTIHFAFHIFNGVFQAVEEFVGVRQPQRLVFATKKEQLADIYAVYLRRERATIEGLGYRLLAPQNVPPFTEYVLERTGPSSWVS